MKSIFVLNLIIYSIFTGFCNAQECKFIKKFKSSNYDFYAGIIDIPPDYNNTISNKFFKLDLVKYVIKSDTNFVFDVEIEAFNASKNSSITTVTFQFEDSSKVVKSNQPSRYSNDARKSLIIYKRTVNVERNLNNKKKILDKYYPNR